MTWRDDDIHYSTDLRLFAQTQELFNRYGVKHTIALIAKDIEKNPELIEYIMANDIDVQVHCWEHVDLTLNTDILEKHLLRCMETILSVFGKIPTTVYPPWNKTDEKVNEIASDLGLVVRADKISLSAFVRTNGDVVEDTLNFHYWAPQEIILLEPALKIYTS